MAEQNGRIVGGKYVLDNHEKVNRAIYGFVTSGGQMKGGVGEDASDDAILAEYDRLGGLVLLAGRKVKTGSFYDLVARKPRTEPKVVLVVKTSKGFIEVPADKIPVEALAEEMAEADPEAESDNADEEESEDKPDKSSKPAKGKKKADSVDEE